VALRGRRSSSLGAWRTAQQPYARRLIDLDGAWAVHQNPVIV
jgi:hypothetical protein